MTPLARLLAAVEAGPLWLPGDLAISKRASKMINAAFPDDEDGENFCAAYGEGDVTAAISLCGAMLPGCTWAICKGEGAIIWDDPEYPPEGESDNPDPARALLIALLRAMVAQEGGE